MKKGIFIVIDGTDGSGKATQTKLLASILYAGDRFEEKKVIEKWLNEGFVVIADRYASSNQIHQGGKISNSAKRKEFLAWLEDLEYWVFKIPPPDAIIYF